VNWLEKYPELASIFYNAECCNLRKRISVNKNDITVITVMNNIFHAIFSLRDKKKEQIKNLYCTEHQVLQSIITRILQAAMRCPNLMDCPVFEEINKIFEELKNKNILPAAVV